MKLIHYFLLIPLLIAFSCENDTVNRENISMGAYNDMLVETYDTFLIGGYHDMKSLDIDLNKDGRMDLRLLSEIWGSPGIGQHPRSEIMCLHDAAELYGHCSNDTSFRNSWTRILTGPDNTIEIHEYINYSCHWMDGSGITGDINREILAIDENRFKIVPLERTDQIAHSDIFEADSVTLSDDWYSYPSTWEEAGTDTIRFIHTSFENNCHSFPLDEVRYIGVKITSGEYAYLGWIKLSITDRYKILLMESALQR